MFVLPSIVQKARADNNVTIVILQRLSVNCHRYANFSYLGPCLPVVSVTMIDFSQWRVRIGAWNCCILRSRRGVRIGKNRTLKEKKHGVIDLISGTFTSLIFILSLLLILSGDIEINPGPATLLGIYI